ncbi:MAG: hypothetical protein LBU11_01745, partial [Zoogloeaceae bacterium]|nr:hypothetical protein [Zoogloeaceae bacterium]
FANALLFIPFSPIGRPSFIGYDPLYCPLCASLSGGNRGKWDEVALATLKGSILEPPAGGASSDPVTGFSFPI